MELGQANGKKHIDGLKSLIGQLSLEPCSQPLAYVLSPISSSLLPLPPPSLRQSVDVDANHQFSLEVNKYVVMSKFIKNAYEAEPKISMGYVSLPLSSPSSLPSLLSLLLMDHPSLSFPLVFQSIKLTK